MDLAASVFNFLLFQVAISSVTCKWIDMSYAYEDDMITWNGVPPFKLTNVQNGSSLNIPYVYFNKMGLGEHTGTHIDAPIHFALGQKTVDEIPVESLIGPAVVVNISEKASKNRNAQLTVSDLEKWEKDNGRIPDGSILLMFSGWGKYWGDFEKYMGTSNYNATYSATEEYKFPGIHPNASQWLVDNRKIKGIGVDSRSLDYGQTAEYLSHRILLGHGLFGLESLANMDKLPAKGTTLFVIPMKIKNGSGGPARVLARLDGEVNGSSKNKACFFFVVLTLFLALFF